MKIAVYCGSDFGKNPIYTEAARELASCMVKSVIRYNAEYVLPSLEKAGEVYCDKLENGFDMYY